VLAQVQAQNLGMGDSTLRACTRAFNIGELQQHTIQRERGSGTHLFAQGIEGQLGFLGELL
jgi:hypothetical protein